jgi:hypothetical protein
MAGLAVLRTARRRLILHKSGKIIMAENSGGIGVMGVVVGALIVAVVGTGVLFATGTIGSKTSTVKVELPKVTVK